MAADRIAARLERGPSSGSTIRATGIYAPRVVTSSTNSINTT
jgi:hypothetical protein